jgi:hypothetical protein
MLRLARHSRKGGKADQVDSGLVESATSDKTGSRLKSVAGMFQFKSIPECSGSRVYRNDRGGICSYDRDWLFGLSHK